MAPATMSPGAPGWLPSLLAAGALAAARTVPITWLCPAFGGPRAGGVTRVGLGLALAALVLPRLLPGPAAGAVAALAGGLVAPAGVVLWLLLIARELLIGTTVGLVASAAFHAAAAAGWLSDQARAGAAAGAEAALSSSQGAAASPLAELYTLLAIVIFLRLGGVGQLAAALSRSYDAVPLGAGVTGTAAALPGAAAVVIAASARLIESALALAAPVLVALLLADVVLGAIARIALRGGAASAGLRAPARALLGTAVVLATLGAVDGALASGLPGWGQLVARAFAAWAH